MMAAKFSQVAPVRDAAKQEQATPTKMAARKSLPGTDESSGIKFAPGYRTHPAILANIPLGEPASSHSALGQTVRGEQANRMKPPAASLCAQKQLERLIETNFARPSDKVDLYYRLNQFESGASNLSELLTSLLHDSLANLPDDPGLKFELLALVRELYIEPRLASEAARDGGAIVANNDNDHHQRHSLDMRLLDASIQRLALESRLIGAERCVSDVFGPRCEPRKRQDVRHVPLLSSAAAAAPTRRNLSSALCAPSSQMLAERQENQWPPASWQEFDVDEKKKLQEQFAPLAERCAANIFSVEAKHKQRQRQRQRINLRAARDDNLLVPQMCSQQQQQHQAIVAKAATLAYNQQDSGSETCSSDDVKHGSSSAWQGQAGTSSRAGADYSRRLYMDAERAAVWRANDNADQVGQTMLGSGSPSPPAPAYRAALYTSGGLDRAEPSVVKSSTPPSCSCLCADCACCVSMRPCAGEQASARDNKQTLSTSAPQWSSPIVCTADHQLQPPPLSPPPPLWHHNSALSLPASPTCTRLKPSPTQILGAAGEPADTTNPAQVEHFTFAGPNEQAPVWQGKQQQQMRPLASSIENCCLAGRLDSANPIQRRSIACPTLHSSAVQLLQQQQQQQQLRQQQQPFDYQQVNLSPTRSDAWMVRGHRSHEQRSIVVNQNNRLRHRTQPKQRQQQQQFACQSDNVQSSDSCEKDDDETEIVTEALVPSQAKGRLPLSVAEQMSEQANKFVQQHGSASGSFRSSYHYHGHNRARSCSASSSISGEPYHQQQHHHQHHHHQQQRRHRRTGDGSSRATRPRRPIDGSNGDEHALENNNDDDDDDQSDELPATKGGNNLKVRRTLRVRIRKSKPILGIAIEGGFNVSGQLLPRIVCVHEEGAAYQCGKLRASDLILEVNGISTVNMTHDEIAKTIATAYYQDERPNIEFLVGESVHV